MKKLLIILLSVTFLASCVNNQDASNTTTTNEVVIDNANSYGEIITLDEEKIGTHLKEQSVLVNRAGGSKGSKLCRQICRFKLEKIILFERAESLLHAVTHTDFTRFFMTIPEACQPILQAGSMR